ncbi:hypothetical protein ACFSQQ_28620 [Mesorhizobium kowhaii]|uniref:hypothetical protein n=1 Tax=Mesorhizobium kowhaii TaxID=1300272 RepID=UPI0035F015FB
MCEVINFASRCVATTEPMIETKSDWSFECAPLAGFSEMVTITIVAEVGAVEEIEKHHEQMWVEHMRLALASAKAERAARVG